MEDSERLRNRTDEVAARRARRNAEPQRFNADHWRKQAIAHGADPAAFEADPEENARVMQARDRELRHARLAKQSAILLARLPRRYQDATLGTDPAGQLAAAWLASYRRGHRDPLVIIGPTGTGKTWTACALARHLLTEDTVPVQATTAAEFLAALRPGTGIDTDMLAYTLAPVLVLDDLGAENLTDWGMEQLYRLAHERSHNARPTIVTSNLEGAAIREKYGDRFTERMFGGAKLIRLAGDTRRNMPDGF